MKNKRLRINVSSLFIYYNARILYGLNEDDMEDIGCQIDTAIEGLKKYGCCKESFFKFDMKNLNRKPPQFCYREAKKYRLLEGQNLQVNLSQMKACLAEGYPFTFGIQTFESFSGAQHGGRIKMPRPDEPTDVKHGFHAMLAVGYSDVSKCFIARNSWGTKWVSFRFRTINIVP